MKYVYLVQSNYKGENAQGNVLGVHSSRAGAFEHFNDIRDDRQRRSKIAWDNGPMQDPAEERKYRWQLASFYVADERWPEIVELTRRSVCRRKKGKK